MNYQNSVSAEQIKRVLCAQGLQSLRPDTGPVSAAASAMAALDAQRERLQRLAVQLESTFAPVIHEQNCHEESADHPPIAPMPSLLFQITEATHNLTNSLNRIQSVIDRSAL